jgi:hypothetical protein
MAVISIHENDENCTEIEEDEMKSIVVFLCAALFVSLSYVPVYGEEKTGMDAKVLFETKCSTCHSADRAKKKQKTAEEWAITVMRMKNVRGCPVTDDEAKLIINYLAKNYGPPA